MDIHAVSTVFYVNVASNQINAALAALGAEFDSTPAVYYEVVDPKTTLGRAIIRVNVGSTGDFAKTVRRRLERVQP